MNSTTCKLVDQAVGAVFVGIATAMFAVPVVLMLLAPAVGGM